jgi:hypothetical protein
MMAHEDQEQRRFTKASVSDGDKVDEAEKMEPGTVRDSFDMPQKTRPAMGGSDVPGTALPTDREAEQEWRPADDAEKEHPNLRSLPDDYESKQPGTGNIKGNRQ